MAKFDPFTGYLKFRNIEFVFTFDGELITLTPPQDKKWEVGSWFLREIGPNSYTIGDPLEVEEDFLIGKCAQNGKTVVFFPRRGNIGQNNSVLHFYIDYFIVHSNDDDEFIRMEFSSPIINLIYPDSGIETTFNDGHYIITNSSENRKDKTSGKFNFQGVEVSVSFTTGFNIKFYSFEPLKVYSLLVFSFQKTKNYIFIKDLFLVAKKALQFLSYRNELGLINVKLTYADPFSGTGTFDECNNSHLDIEEKSWALKYEYFKNNLSELFQNIADNRFYTKHIPEMFSQRRNADWIRYLSITAAFESEFRSVFPQGVPMSPNREKVSSKIKTELDRLISASTGEEKKTYKYLKKRVHDRKLSLEIVYAANELGDVALLTLEKLNKLNNSNITLNDAAESIADQRNDYSHGNIDQEFRDNSIFGLLLLEKMVLILQLKRCNLSEENIKRALEKF